MCKNDGQNNNLTWAVVEYARAAAPAAAAATATAGELFGATLVAVVMARTASGATRRVRVTNIFRRISGSSEKVF